ncbi:MAG: hypothetical protein AAF547_17280 [Actinomycetota bacterium]
MSLYHLTYRDDVDAPAEAEQGAPDAPTRGPITDRAVTAALASYGVAVLRAEAAGRPHHQIDALVDVTRPIDLPVIEHVLRGQGRTVLHLAEVPDRGPAAA